MSGEYYFFIRLRSTQAASGLYTPSFTYGNAVTFFDAKWITPTASYANHFLGAGTVDETLIPLAVYRTFKASVTACPTSGSIAMDSFYLMPRPLLRLVPNASTDAYIVRGSRSAGIRTSDDQVRSWVTTYGDPLGVNPGAFNYLIGATGSNGEPANKADTMTFRSVRVTPRYGLL